MRARRALAILALAALPSAAADPVWPPSDGVAARMRALQGVLGDREATPAQREAAREELSSLLKSPAGQARGRSADEKPVRPARAAIEPVPTTVIPAPANPIATPGVARLEVIDPPRPTIDPRTGLVMPQVGNFTVDPRTGHILHPVPGGDVDPRTGLISPR